MNDCLTLYCNPVLAMFPSVTTRGCKDGELDFSPRAPRSELSTTYGVNKRMVGSSKKGRWTDLDDEGAGDDVGRA